MKDFKVLRFLDRFKDFFSKIGVDYNLMRKILQVKLIMDSRKVPTAMNRSDKNNKDESNTLRPSWVYVLLGVILVPMIITGKNYIFQMSFVFGILIFMIMTSLISDFSSVLLDVRDKNIIASKPVDSRTISMAKIIHVLIYMITLTFSLAGIPLIAALITQGFLFFIIFLLEIILMDLFIVMITALFYLLILRFFDGEKLKDIINYVQILLSITLSIGYQLIGRLFNLAHLNVNFTPKWWQYFIVPIWFGSPFEVILRGNHNVTFIIFSVLAVIVPIISIIIYIKLVPAFERNLQKLNNNSSRSKGKNKGLIDKLSRLFCFNKEEKIFFNFASDMMVNEREFKLKVYPSLGFAIIFPFIIIFSSLGSDSWSSIVNSKLYLSIYFCALMLPTVVMMMKYSGKYQGAWIYYTMPIKDVAAIFKGTLKALIIRLLLPIYLLDCIIFIAIFRIRIIPDLIVVFLNILLFTVLCFKAMKKSFPFSMKFGISEKGEGLIVILLMVLLAALAGIHYLCTLGQYRIYIYILVLFILDILLWKKSFNISKEDL